MADSKENQSKAADSKTYKVKNNEANIRYVQGVALKPGVETDVSAEQLDKMKASKSVVPLFDKKIIEIV